MVADAGRKLHAISADLGSTEPIARVVFEAYAAAGRIDILVNNAGIIRRADSVDFTEDDWDAVMDTNLKTAFFLSQAVAKRWVGEGRGGKIIQVASMLSFQGGVRVPSYTASKSGLAGLTKALANEWAAKGINVNAIAPGYFVSNNTEALRADETRSRQIMERIPAGRWGQPEDLAGVAVFLASQASDYMHGAIVPVDGGWLAR
jgi:2-deoxy-D-gluconate 3-dehydrogenase